MLLLVVLRRLPRSCCFHNCRQHKQSSYWPLADEEMVRRRRRCPHAPVRHSSKSQLPARRSLTKKEENICLMWRCSNLSPPSSTTRPLLTKIGRDTHFFIVLCKQTHTETLYQENTSPQPPPHWQQNCRSQQQLKYMLN